MKWLITLVFSLFVFCSCATHSPPKAPAAPKYAEITFHADTEFTPDERRVIQNACDDWLSLSHGRVRLRVEWDLDFSSDSRIAALGEGPIIVRMTEDMLTVALADLHFHARLLGWTTPADHQIFLVQDRILAESNPWTIYTHEMGHAVGLDHTCEHCSDVMSASYGGSIAFTPRDEKECRDNGLCP